VKLDAVHDAALAEALADANEIRRAAHDRAAEVLSNARAEADALVHDRLEAAQALAESLARGELARARGAARATVLHAQRTVLNEAIAAARDRARGLTGDPRYERMVARVTAEARARLAGGGEVSIARAPSGGVIARAGSRGLDYSLDAQIERALESVSSELEGLWR
jgi:vacuolar-type H+-ATPase subunit E/Vma4